MIHATLQIKISSHRALKNKTLAVIKDSSGKPIFFCSLIPRYKKRNKGAKSHVFTKCGSSLPKRIGTKLGTPIPPTQFFPVGSAAKSLSPTRIGAKSHTFKKCEAKPWAVAQEAKIKKNTFFSAKTWAFPIQGKLKKQTKPLNKVQQRYAQKWTQPGVERIAPSKWNGFAPFLSLRSSKTQSQRRRRLLVSFLKELASRQSTPLPTGKQPYKPLLVNLDALNSSSKGFKQPTLPLNHSGWAPNPLGGDLLKSLRGNLSPPLRRKSLDLEAKLLGLKLGKACIFKGIQSIDVVMKEYTKPICLLLQGLRIAGVRFNRLRILRVSDLNYNVHPVSEHEMNRLALARKIFRPSLSSLKRSNFAKLSTPNPHVPLLTKSEEPLPFGQRGDFIAEALASHSVSLPGGNKSGSLSWLLDISPKNELLQILVKSRLIKKSTRHTFWQARSFKYKIEKLLYRKNRIGVIREKVYCPLIQKKAVKKWKAFTDFSAASRAKEQVFGKRTPFYRLRRSFAPFVSKSSSITYHFLPKARKRLKKRVAWLKAKKFQSRSGIGSSFQSRSGIGSSFQSRSGIGSSFHTFEKNGSSPKKSGSFQKRPHFRVNQTRKIANVQNTLNNTIITITDRFGNTKVWCSSGSIGLRASRRSTNYAAQSVAEAVAKKCRKLGIRRVEVRVQGVGYGKPSALKGLRIGGLQIKRIVDTTPKPHNGCRAPKKRRV